MSMSATYHARLWAKGKTNLELVQRIKELEAHIKENGADPGKQEFDWQRHRHMCRTEIEYYQAILDGKVKND